MHTEVQQSVVIQINKQHELWNVCPCNDAMNCHGHGVRVTDEQTNTESKRNESNRKAEEVREKSVLMPLNPPRIPCGLAWDCTWASVIKRKLPQL